MISRRIVANLVVVLALFAVLCAWAVSNVIRFDAIERPMVVTAQFDTSPGLRRNFEVAYLGLRVGNIGQVRLVDDHVEVELKIDRGQDLPAGVGAAVRRKSAVGEPYVDLVPPEAGGAGGSAPPSLAHGDVIPVDRTTVPLSYGQLFSSLADLVDALPPEDVRTLLHEMAQALDGRGDDLRSMLVDTGDIAATVAEQPDLLPDVVSELSRFTRTLAEHSDGLGRSLDGLAAVSETLAANRGSLVALFERVPEFTAMADRLLVETSGELGCTLSGLGDLATALSSAERLDEVSRILDLAQGVIDVFTAIRYEDESGTWLDATFQFADGAGEPVRSYHPPHELPEPGSIPECTQQDIRRAIGTAGDTAVDSGAPPTTAAGPSSPDDVAAPQPAAPAVPDSTDRAVESSSLLDHLGTALAALVAAAVVLALAVAKPWRRLGGGR